MNEETKRRYLLPTLVVLWLVVLTLGSGYVGYQIGVRKEGDGTGTSDRPSLSLFWQAWDVINDRFLGDEREDAEKRIDGAISGMVSSLGDPYTVYLPPKQDDLFRSNLQGTFGGIGAELEVRESQLTIVAPLSGTPAEAAGLRAGDIVNKIDGNNVLDMSFDDAITAIRGEPGTEVVLTILREGESEPLDITITRDTIVVKSVEVEQLANGRVDYIKVNQFGDDTSALLRAALSEAVANNRAGAVLDLRNNPGGYLTGAIEAIGMVLPDTIESEDPYLSQRTAVREKARGDKEVVEKATNPSVAANLPIVVLVNKGSASASEIFAGAMKDYGRAKIVGETTFGKGSVQDLVELRNGGSIKVTIAQWLTPKGAQINKVGITPDVQVSLPEDATPAADDAQVTAALEALGI